MKAMILAAGRGERMRPLTNNLPKPMLPVGGKPLLQHHVEALARAGIADLVINHSCFGKRIEAWFDDGAAFGVNIRYSPEGDSPLGTGGGIKRALPLLGNEPFLVINGDVWTDFPLETLKSARPDQAHLVLVANPAHHPQGDFVLQNGNVSDSGAPKHTFSGIGVYRPSLFKSVETALYRHSLKNGKLSAQQDAASATHFPLAPLLRQAMQTQQVSGELYGGLWLDIGTPARLAQLEDYLGA